MAEKTKDLVIGHEQINADKIQARRGTANPLRDPSVRQGLALAQQAVQAQLIEEEGYVKVRHTGTEEFVWNHKYWLPGEVRLLHPGELELLEDQYSDSKNISFSKVSHHSIGEIGEDHEEVVAEALGTSHDGAKQAAVIEAGLVPPLTEKEAAADRKAADETDAALQRRAARDAAKPKENEPLKGTEAPHGMAKTQPLDPSAERDDYPVKMTSAAKVEKGTVPGKG